MGKIHSGTKRREGIISVKPKENLETMFKFAIIVALCCIETAFSSGTFSCNIGEMVRMHFRYNNL